MIIKLNNIKEVEIKEKLEFKYYLLFSYNSKTKDPNLRYFLIDQSQNIDYIVAKMDSWELNSNEIFKVFEVMLPN